MFGEFGHASDRHVGIQRFVGKGERDASIEELYHLILSLKSAETC